MDSFILKSKFGGLGVGENYPIRVNCNIGINCISEYHREIDKIDSIFNSKFVPDIMMDLSTIKINEPLYEYIINEKKIPVGTVPTYTLFEKNKGFDKIKLLDSIEDQAYKGVSFFTLHFTATPDLYEIAKKNRKIPVTSRGGGLVLFDSVFNKRDGSLLIELFDDIVNIALNHDILISLGTTFRPAGIIEARDEVHIKETIKQLEICKKLRLLGVKVMLENFGHIDLIELEKHVEIIKEFNVPIMPLGPIPTDIAIDNDHIAAAIGASFSCFWGIAHIINSISPFEHSKSDITINDTIKAIETAQLAAHIVNLTRFSKCRDKDINILNERSKTRSCIMDNSIACNRCSDKCPLKLPI